MDRYLSANCGINPLDGLDGFQENGFYRWTTCAITEALLYNSKKHSLIKTKCECYNFQNWSIDP